MFFFLSFVSFLNVVVLWTRWCTLLPRLAAMWRRLSWTILISLCGTSEVRSLWGPHGIRITQTQRWEVFCLTERFFFFSATGSHVTIFSTTFYLFNLLWGCGQTSLQLTVNLIVVFFFVVFFYFPFSCLVCNRGGGQHRQRKDLCDQGGTL